jgi:hypothetical protein
MHGGQDTNGTPPAQVELDQYEERLVAQAILDEVHVLKPPPVPLK